MGLENIISYDVVGEGQQIVQNRADQRIILLDVELAHILLGEDIILDELHVVGVGGLDEVLEDF